MTLKVFDLPGREVAALVNEKKAPGSHSATFGGSRLTGGVYFYRLDAGRFVDTRAMVVLK